MRRLPFLFLIFIFLFSLDTRAADLPFLGKKGDGLSLLQTRLLNSIQLDVTLEPTATAGEINLMLLGRVAAGKHIYSILDQGEYGPKATKVVLDHLSFSPLGSRESAPKVIFDGAFEASLKVHQRDFWISRKFKVSKEITGKNEVFGYLEFQVCDDLICSLPVKKPFKALLNQ